MTQSLELINSGAPLTTAFTPTTANNILNNAELGWVAAVSNASPAVWPTAATSGASSMPVLALSRLWIAMWVYATSTYEQLVITPTGATSFGATSGLPASTLTLAYNAIEGLFIALPRSASTTRYISSAATLATFTSHVQAANLGCYAAVHNGLAVASNGAFVAVGFVGSYGHVITTDGTTQIYSGDNTNTTVLTDVARSSSGALLVAVGAGACSRSNDYGVTWTHGTLPALPGTAVGSLSVTYSAYLSQFICSGVLSTGVMFWATSATGASWTSWHYSDQLAIGTAPLSGAGSPACGITTVDKTWVAPYITGTATVPLAGLMVSIDSGASWRAIEGGEPMANLNFLKCLTIGNRVAIVSRGSTVLTAAITGSDKANST